MHHGVEDLRNRDPVAVTALDALCTLVSRHVTEKRTGDAPRPPKLTALLMLARNSNHEHDGSAALARLVGRGTRTNATDASGSRALHLAAGTGSMWAVQPHVAA